MIRCKSPEEIRKMRLSNRAAREILFRLGEKVKPGITPVELDEWARELARRYGGRPSFLGYRVGRRVFPAAICASPNEVVVHGIPRRRPLEEGSILGIDFGIRIDGLHGDTAFTFPVGKISPQVERLLRVTREALFKGIEKAVVGNRIGDIAHAIQTHVERHGYGVVKELCGHGVGYKLHEEPQVPNYGQPGKGPPLKPGMTLAIEPMVTMGSPEVEVLPDGWTVVTKDRSWSAHFEHTIVILSDGPEILSLPEEPE